VSNAIRYTRIGAVRVRAFAQEAHLAIEVSDTGIGIAPEEMGRIFEEFYQIGNPERDREQGTGLGLAIVRRYADLLQCTITVQSVLGQGSQFRILVPLSSVQSAPADALPADPTQDAVDLTGLTVLVIDDDLAVRTAMEKLLTDWGCIALVSADPDDAIATVERHGGSVDFVIADYRLRQGQDGIGCLRRLRARYGDVPALLVSGDTAQDRLAEAAASGFPMLHKPVSPERLQRKIQEICERHRSTVG
jgi:CheY-like chemotaxis protein